jgi:cobalt-zinc-cadmium efflux system membrane fusion protein
MKNSILVILISAVFASCGHKSAEKEVEKTEKEAPINSIVELSPEQYKTLGISLVKGENKKMKGILSLNGSLNVPPQYTVSLNAPFGGFIKTLLVQEGSPVRQGQLLATVQNPEYIQLQQDYLENKSQLSYLETEYKRQEELAKEQVNSQKALQKAKADLDLNKAKLAGQKAKLQMLGIDVQKLENGEINSIVPLNSPINGYVTAVKTNLGAYIGNTDVILEMMDAQHLYAELAVYEKDLAKLQTGQKVSLTLVGEKEARRGTIHLIGRKVNEDRTLHVYCRFDKTDASLRPGMFLKGSVEVSDYEAMSVPESSVVGFNGKNYVFVANAERSFEMKEVQTGIRFDGHIEILSGITPDKQVVDKGAFQLLATLKNAGE